MLGMQTLCYVYKDDLDIFAALKELPIQLCWVGSTDTIIRKLQMLYLKCYNNRIYIDDGNVTTANIYHMLGTILNDLCEF